MLPLAAAGASVVPTLVTALKASPERLELAAAVVDETANRLDPRQRGAADPAAGGGQGHWHDHLHGSYRRNLHALVRKES